MVSVYCVENDVAIDIAVVSDQSGVPFPESEIASWNTNQFRHPTHLDYVLHSDENILC
jgi:hypothetical protein